MTTPSARLLLWAALSVALLASPSQAVTNKPCPIRRQLEKWVAENTYVTFRGLRTYVSELPPQFVHDLAGLGPDAHILDMGAGQANAGRNLYNCDFIDDCRIVIRDSMPPKDFNLLERFLERPVSERPKMTAIATQAPREAIPERMRDKLRFVVGDFLKLPDHELGKADLMADMYGIFMYTDDPSAVLEKYFRLLKKDARAYIHFGTFSPAGEDVIIQSVATSDGRVLSFSSWIRSLPGIRAQVIRDAGQFGFETLQLVGTGGEVHIPKLKIERFHMADQGPRKRVRVISP
ncbi:MAG: class I SAM-dependent methyltransferase [Bdellovibrionota bacterium]